MRKPSTLIVLVLAGVGATALPAQEASLSDVFDRVSGSVVIVVTKQREIADEGPGKLGQAELFQTNAAINQGNSGGPMFNMEGEVIGIVSPERPRR